ncbi:MAG: hypothetical protein ABI220_04420 [Candidatus Saccharimonadales bacterium]
MYKVEPIRLSPLVLTVSFVAAMLAALVLAVSPTSAASLNKSFVRFDRMKVNTATTGTVCATPTTLASVEGKVAVTFPTGYTVSPTAGNWVTSTTNLAWPTVSGYTTAAWPGIGTATVVAAQVVTFPSGDLTSATTLYCFNWTNTAAVSISATASSSNSGLITTQLAAGTAIDSSNFATASITDDQILVTASVAQTFSFAISGNTDSLGNLSTAAVSTSPTPRTATINTNAKNGWNVWANDSSTGLKSVSAAATIDSTTPGTNSTLAAGTEGYNTGVTSAQAGGSGTLTVAPAFVGGSAGKGGGLNLSLANVASSNGTANNAVLTLTNNASIGSLTAAATDYADTITVVGAGLF